MYNLGRLIIVLILLNLAIFQSACGPYNAGVVFSTKGEDFSSFEVFVDGNSVGSTKGSAPIISFSLRPGTHLIEIVGNKGRKLKIESSVEPGEHYVIYYADEALLIWNDNRYEIEEDKRVIINNTLTRPFNSDAGMESGC